MLLIVLGLASLGACDAAAQKGKKKKSSPATESAAIRVDSLPRFQPTRTRAPGTVASYFWPMQTGASWLHRTVRIRMDDSAKVIATDTSFNMHRVISDTAFSLQRLPLVTCEVKGYLPGGLDTGRGFATYYADDSVAMTVVNNSVTHRLNNIFLVSPLTEGNAWHEKYDDSAYCVISGWVDSVVTPMKRFDSVLVTVTRAGHTELVKFYAQGYGLIKSVFRSPGPGNHGLVAMVTEMMALKPPEKKEILGNK